ncbi:MAG: SDR family NAD(P)-dependent oxidoreductase [Bacteroidales bacterium]|nr:SDR family NAD(P)-dependent oxidoreductase [Bacteroidales bacterium]
MEKKVILVTGASSGIGYDTAKALASRGHKVYAAARRTELMEPLKEQGVSVMRMDVTDEQSMADGVEAILKAEGRIDVLVNNAGYGYFGAIETVAMAEARRQLEVNVFGLARLCQLVLPAMRGRRSGRIVNISSVAGRSVIYFGGWYHVSKYSVEAFSDALRMEVKPFGIDVSMIEPGAIKTDWGLIAADHLRESTRGTAYEHDASRWAKTMHDMYSSNGLSSPAVVTRAILRAVESRRPRARYRCGRLSGTMLFFHWLLPARWWDGLMRLSARV